MLSTQKPSTDMYYIMQVLSRGFCLVGAAVMGSNCRLMPRAAQFVSYFIKTYMDPKCDLGDG